MSQVFLIALNSHSCGCTLLAVFLLLGFLIRLPFFSGYSSLSFVVIYNPLDCDAENY